SHGFTIATRRLLLLRIRFTRFVFHVFQYHTRFGFSSFSSLPAPGCHGGEFLFLLIFLLKGHSYDYGSQR
ncbi:MAG: hypothetical protein E6905_04470, partial [Actinomyces sp.]|nr:hypothetical protein [Actinomyces sp.]